MFMPMPIFNLSNFTQKHFTKDEWEGHSSVCKPMACTLKNIVHSLSSLLLHSKVSLRMIHSNDDWTNQLMNKPSDHPQGSHFCITVNVNLNLSHFPTHLNPCGVSQQQKALHSFLNSDKPSQHMQAVFSFNHCKTHGEWQNNWFWLCQQQAWEIRLGNSWKANRCYHACWSVLAMDHLAQVLAAELKDHGCELSLVLQKLMHWLSREPTWFLVPNSAWSTEQVAPNHELATVLLRGFFIMDECWMMIGLSAQEENAQSTRHSTLTTELWLTWQGATDSVQQPGISSFKMLLTSQQVSFLMIHSNDDWTNHLMNHKAVTSATPSMPIWTCHSFKHIWIDMLLVNNKRKLLEQWHTTTACTRASCALMHSLQDPHQSTTQQEKHLMLLCMLVHFRVRNGMRVCCWAEILAINHLFFKTCVVWVERQQFLVLHSASRSKFSFEIVHGEFFSVPTHSCW